MWQVFRIMRINHMLHSLKLNEHVRWILKGHNFSQSLFYYLFSVQKCSASLARINSYKEILWQYYQIVFHIFLRQCYNQLYDLYANLLNFSFFLIFTVLFISSMANIVTVCVFSPWTAKFPHDFLLEFLAAFYECFSGGENFRTQN